MRFHRCISVMVGGVKCLLSDITLMFLIAVCLNISMIKLQIRILGYSNRTKVVALPRRKSSVSAAMLQNALDYLDLLISR